MSQCRTNSLPFSILEMLLTGSDCFHVISNCFSFRDLHAFRNWTPPKFANLSKILWKICKFWKRISADQIHTARSMEDETRNVKEMQIEILNGGEILVKCSESR